MIDKDTATTPAVRYDKIGAADVEAALIALHYVDGEGPGRRHGVDAAHDAQKVGCYLAYSAFDARHLAVSRVARVTYALRPEREAVDAHRRLLEAFGEYAWFWNSFFLFKSC